MAKLQCPSCGSTYIVTSKAILDGGFLKTHKTCFTCGTRFDYEDKKV